MAASIEQTDILIRQLLEEQTKQLEERLSAKLKDDTSKQVETQLQVLEDLIKKRQEAMKAGRPR